MSTTVEEIEKSETDERGKDDLLLDSLEIKGYRCFEHLTIEKLGRVNLIVGKNNVGKTALLEALWIWAKCDTWELIYRVLQIILYNRKEISYEPNDQVIELRINGSDFRHLFNQRPKYIGGEDFDVVLLIGENKVVSNAFEAYTKDKEGNNNFSYSLLQEVPWNKRIPFGIRYQSLNGSIRIEKPKHLETQKNDRNTVIHPEIKTKLIQARGLDENFLSEKWNEVVWKNKEQEIINTLKILSNKILNLAFAKYPISSTTEIPVIHVEGIDEKVPLESFGEGMKRLLGIALAISDSHNGILLIDEIESGLHYSVLPDVWKLIFKTAKDLNVQVFATTHSKDCIEAFTQAAIDDEESDGILIRLENKNGKIRAVNFDEDELETIEQRKIEVR